MIKRSLEETHIYSPGFDMFFREAGYVARISSNSSLVMSSTETMFTYFVRLAIFSQLYQTSMLIKSVWVVRRISQRDSRERQTHEKARTFAKPGHHSRSINNSFSKQQFSPTPQPKNPSTTTSKRPTTTTKLYLTHRKYGRRKCTLLCFLLPTVRG